ncbi:MULTISPECIES: hypothetical protein [unclassified Pseudoclavibacter]|uniref:hypothetical protein n=1 Tax=unclassified Pseudoclavibacter TaxID=2615177 RepID=UPI001300CBFA|nr:MULTISPECIES: hypothetical protein [unclassified Pseudoclavibacter]KAB1657406.1 hypothetical protein F8O09_07095 [Pseudoclavibacter sp. CFCC 11306]KAB1660721.1 hypothetical protein F8O07_01695 [Pseudoclavibacter sp. CFCC 13796]
MAAKKADLSSIELPEEFSGISVQKLQDVSDALQKAADAALLAAETGTEPAQWRRLSVSTLTSTISRTAIETIMRVTNIHPATLRAQLTAAAAINAEQIARGAELDADEIKTSVAASEEALRLLEAAIQHLTEVIGD